MAFAVEYDRIWSDTWSGQKKSYFYSYEGTSRTWKLPENWADVESALLYPLTPDGRGKPVRLTTADRVAAPSLLPQVPYVVVTIND